MSSLANEAAKALGDLLDKLDTFPPTVADAIRENEDVATVARLMWLDGYKAGMDATKAALATVLS